MASKDKGPVKHKYQVISNNTRLDGQDVKRGAIVELTDSRASALVGKVKRIGEVEPELDVPEDEKDGGPTIEEFLEAGYMAKNYPPAGFKAVKSEGLERFQKTGRVYNDPSEHLTTAGDSVTPQQNEA